MAEKQVEGMTHRRCPRCGKLHPMAETTCPYCKYTYASPKK